MKDYKTRQYTVFLQYLIGVIAGVFCAPSAFAAGPDISYVAGNITQSASDLPGLVSALAYLLGLLFGVRGILKLKAHVENPGGNSGAGETPLRTPMISFFVGGALFALPLILQAAMNAINGSEATGAAGALGNASDVIGGTADVAGGINFNTILDNIILSMSDLPGLITALAYLMGIVIIVMGLLKIKEHVESPEQTQLKDGVIRMVIGGALLTMPPIFNAMFNTIDGGIGISNLFGEDFFVSEYATAENCNRADGGGPDSSMGQLICSITAHTGLFPAFLTALSYIFGLVMGVWGILKIRDHVLNPQQTDIFQGISRLLAGGGFFALPALVEVFATTFDGGGFGIAAVGEYNMDDINSGGGACPADAGLGLDGVLACFATDILGPVHSLLSFFAFVAGIIFIMIGVSRLIKSAQEGARGPGGIGTIMTFGMGGALIANNDLMRAATSTFTGQATTATFANMQYTKGMTGDELAAAHTVISSILKFMIVVGLISFVRGLFIVRSVAEGNQQASMMAAVTHIVGGALAVNLGPVLNAMQSTLGTTGYGITFTP